MRPVAPVHARALAARVLAMQVPPEPNAERRPEAQRVEQLKARPVSAQPREVAERHSVRWSPMQPAPERDAAEPLAVAAWWAWSRLSASHLAASHLAAARVAAGRPRGAPEAARPVWRRQEQVQEQIQAQVSVSARAQAGRCRRRPEPVAAGLADWPAQDWKQAQTPDVRTRAAVADPCRCRRAADSANSPPFPRSHERKSPRPERVTGERAHARLCIVADFSPTAHDYCTRVREAPTGT